MTERRPDTQQAPPKGRSAARPGDNDELSEEALELVTGGMGPVIAVENYASLVSLLAGPG